MKARKTKFSYKAYYAENREKLLERRRQRYKKDKDYREKAKQRSRDWSKRQPKKQVKERPPLPETRRFLADKIVKIGGRHELLISSGKLAMRLGVSPQTLVNWRKESVLPGATLVDDGGRYWFSKRYTKAMRGVIDRLIRDQTTKGVQWTLDELRKRFKEAWQKRVRDRESSLGGR